MINLDMEFKDYYKTLNISFGASDEEIKKSYKQLAKKHHPDSDGGSEEKFKEIQEAYEVLKDKAKKDKYDSMHNSQTNFSSKNNTYQNKSSSYSYTNGNPNSSNTTNNQANANSQSNTKNNDNNASSANNTQQANNQQSYQQKQYNDIVFAAI